MNVLEVGGGPAAVATRFLADIGADVVKLEPRNGNGVEEPSARARQQYLDADKSSVVLDLEADAGRRALAQLIGSVDLVVEATIPGELAQWGGDYASMSASRPALSFVSITPFGQTGPYADHPADDLVVFAMGGLMYISGSLERPPVVAPGSQAVFIAGVHGAIAALAADRATRLTGRGMWCDVSMLECQAALENTITNHRGPGKYARRMGSQHRMANPGRIFRARDGFIHLFIGREPGVWDRFLDWLGMPPELISLDLADIDRRWEHVDVVTRVTERLMATRDVEDLAASAQERHLAVVPVYGIEQAIDNPQVRHLDLFESVGSGGEAYLTLRPLLWDNGPRRPAPSTGQDSGDVLAALGLSESEIDEATGSAAR